MHVIAKCKEDHCGAVIALFLKVGYIKDALQDIKGGHKSHFDMWLNVEFDCKAGLWIHRM